MTCLPTPVMVETPYNAESSREIELNIFYALHCMRDSLTRNEAPMLTHLLYTRIPSGQHVSDNDPKHCLIGRDAGLRCAQAWRSSCKRTIMYIDRGISAGMQRAIDEATGNGDVVVEYRNLPNWEDIKKEFPEKPPEIIQTTGLFDQLDDHPIQMICQILHDQRDHWSLLCLMQAGSRLRRLGQELMTLAKVETQEHHSLVVKTKKNKKTFLILGIPIPPSIDDQSLDKIILPGQSQYVLRFSWNINMTWILTGPVSIRDLYNSAGQQIREANTWNFMPINIFNRLTRVQHHIYDLEMSVKCNIEFRYFENESYDLSHIL